jgi:hypothetical protein
MRARVVSAVLAPALATVALLWSMPAPAYGDVIATTGPATAVTNSSAIIHGVALTVNPISAWVFQYGPSAAYGSTLTGSVIGTGLNAVSGQVTGLAPNTTYHYRLVVVLGVTIYVTGGDSTFTTAPAVTFGAVSLPSHRLTTRGRYASIPVRCGGAREAVCSGTVDLLARGKGRRRIQCGTAALTLSGGQRGTLEAHISSACAARLRSSPAHTLRATLVGAITGASALLSEVVTLSL